MTHLKIILDMGIIMCYLQCLYKRLGFLLVTILLFISCSLSGGDVVDDDNDDEDIIPPMTIIDLRVTSFGTDFIILEWTVPGDDSITNVAFEYDFRASQDTITSDNFDDAFEIDDIDPPLPPGNTQSFTADGLESGEKYYFAIKTRDNANNWSEISNCVSQTCLVDEVVNFPDEALDSLIRETISLPTGDIHLSDLEDLTDLAAEDAGITDLSGIENCLDLHWINLMGNNISDLTPLSGLPEVSTLNLINNNISDISPVSSMTSINHLHLGENPVSDISVLSNLVNLALLRLNSTQVTDYSPVYSLPLLEELDLSSNSLSDIAFVANFTQVKVLSLRIIGISDISALSGLINLENLNLFYNEISNLTPLLGLSNISQLDLGHNQIEDISPLVNNNGIGSGDVITLTNNPLSSVSIDTYIPSLEARGATVQY